MKSDRQKNLKAFTLAEVLITLGIIGIVASLTIPSLINKSETAQYRAGLKKAYSIISQAHAQLINDGDMPYKSISEYADAFKTYLKVRSSCTSPGYSCWHDDNSWYTLSNTPISSALFAHIGYVYNLTDGSMIMVAYQSYGTSGGQKPSLISGGIGSFGDIYVDVNGDKKPNRMGYDIYVFQYFGDKILPGGSDGAFYNSTSTYCDRTQTSASTYYSAGCAAHALSGEDY